MADLPTNYYDDILSASMNGKKKFRLTYRNGTTEEVTIEDISEYDQYGSKFGAGDINKTNQAVNEKFDSDDVVDPMLTTEPGFAADAYQTKLQLEEQNKKLVSNGTSFHFDFQNDKWGWNEDPARGADTFHPFNNISDTTAIASKVTSGYVFYDKDGNRCVGTRPVPVTSQSASNIGAGTFGSPSADWFYEGNTYTLNVTFSTPFDKIPTIYITNPSSNLTCSATNVSRTGFTFKIVCSTDEKVKVGWRAEA